jgi:hypothetical protein
LFLFFITIERALRARASRDAIFSFSRLADVSIPAIAYVVSSRLQHASKNHSRKETVFPKSNILAILLHPHKIRA